MTKQNELEKINIDFFSKLDSIFKNVNDWLKFAEQKNAALLLLNGGIVWGITRILNKITTITDAVYWFNLIGYFLTVISAVICIISFLPILQERWFKPKEPDDSDNCLYFADSAKYESREFLKFLAKKLGYKDTKTSFTEFEIDLSKQIVTNSEIALDKYKRFKLAAIFTIWAVVSFLLSIGLNYFME